MLVLNTIIEESQLYKKKFSDVTKFEVGLSWELSNCHLIIKIPNKTSTEFREQGCGNVNKPT